MAMKTNSNWVAVSALAALATIVALSILPVRSLLPIGPPSSTFARTIEDEPVASRAAPEQAEASETRAAVAPMEPSPEASTPDTLAERVVQGRVLDTSGSPCGGLGLGFDASGHGADGLDSTSLAVSGPDGRFEFSTRVEQGKLRILSEGWTTVYQPDVRRPDPRDGYVLVVAQSLALHGTTIDGEGRPVSGARVRLRRPGVQSFDSDDSRFFSSFVVRDPLYAILPAALDQSSAVEWATSSDAEGRFTIEEAPAIQGAMVWASKGGYAAGSQELQLDNPAIQIVLEPEQARTPLLRGQVVDQEARGVAGAQVYLGPSSATTDERGRFAIDANAAPRATRLVAAKEGWYPAVQMCLGTSTSDASAWPDPLVLTLGAECPRICGVVVDADGAPKTAVVVQALESPRLGDLLAWAGEDVAGCGANRTARIDQTTTETGADGRFELKAILPRSSRLCASCRATLEMVTTPVVEPGSTEVLVRLGEPTSPHAGVVVDHNGQGLAKAHVTLRRLLPPIEGEGERALDTDAVLTDEHGRFRIERACVTSDTAIIQQEDAAPWVVVPVPAGQDRQALVLRVPLLGRVQVDTRSSALEIDSFCMLDAAGKQLTLGARRGRGGWVGGDQWSLHSKELSEPVMVSGEATTIVFRSRGKEVARAGVRLVSEDVLVIEP